MAVRAVRDVQGHQSQDIHERIREGNPGRAGADRQDSQWRALTEARVSSDATRICFGPAVILGGWMVSRFGLEQRHSPHGASTVTFDGFSDDIWGGGVRKVFDRLVRELASSEPIECRRVVVVFCYAATVSATHQAKEQHATSRHPS